MIRSLLPRVRDDLGDIGTNPRGSGFAVAPPTAMATAIADPPTRRLFAAGLWPGWADRNRRGRVAQADPLLSAARTAGGSLGSLCARSRLTLPGAWALGAGSDASGIGWRATGHLSGRRHGTDAGHAWNL